MKTFVLTVSTQFPATHKRRGEKTHFTEQILKSQSIPDYWKWVFEVNCNSKEVHEFAFNFDYTVSNQKLHTIRKNYPLWKKRINLVLAGLAILKVCYWQLPGGRFAKGNKLIEICRLDKDSGIGIQKLYFSFDNVLYPVVFPRPLKILELAKNDGLSTDDFKEWFRNYKLDEPLALLHFTNFKY